MGFLPLLAANLLRRKLRSLLLLGSFAAALFLFGLLATLRGAFSQGEEMAGADRLLVLHRVSLIQPLPLAHRDRIARVPGVRALSHASWFGGVYRDERDYFAQFAIEASSWRAMYPEFAVEDGAWQAFLADRAGCIVGEATARRFGWKAGDRIPLRGTIFPGAWEFNLRGIYRGARPQDDATQFWFHHEYLQERGLAEFRGFVGWYVVRIADPDAAPAVAAAIDGLFANSAWETRTQTEKAFAAAFVRQVANIELILTTVGSVVFFTLLLVTANTLAIAIRERRAELAVLQAIGFADRHLLALVLAEAAALALCGASAGLALAKAFTLRGDPTGFLPSFYLAPLDLGLGLLLALGVALLAAAAPAAGAIRLRVADALRRL